MKNRKFLHAADVHLDSPLAKLKRVDEATARRLHRASRRSLELIVEAALEHQVAAVLVAGDLFDGPVKDASAGLWVESLFKRLTREDIRVILIRGNHDAVSNAQRITDWHEGVHELSAKRPESVFLEDVGIAVHGQSFGARVETQDLVSSYPRPAAGFFNIGLLHTSLSGADSRHDTYAPTSISALESTGYDYWALGHIHARSATSLSAECYVGFSGNPQGRHIRESGAKGCQLVELVDGKIKSVDFLPMDSLRWHQLDVDISRLDYLRDIEDVLDEQVAPLIADSEGRPLAVRVRLCGSTALHAELSKHGTQERLTEALSHRMSDLGDIWLESVKIASTPYFSSSPEEVLLPLKYLSQVSESCRNDPNVRRELEDMLEELLKKARFDLAEYGWDLTLASERDAELTRLIGMAEDMLVAQLMGDSPA